MPGPRPVIGGNHRLQVCYWQWGKEIVGQIRRLDALYGIASDVRLVFARPSAKKRLACAVCAVHGAAVVAAICHVQQEVAQVVSRDAGNIARAVPFQSVAQPRRRRLTAAWVRGEQPPACRSTSKAWHPYAR
jgi:hypothetical protein